MSETDDQWGKRAKRLLRAEMVRRSVTYEDMARRLTESGIAETPPNLRNEVSRGRFTAAFLLPCFDVLGCHQLRLH